MDCEPERRSGHSAHAHAALAAPDLDPRVAPVLAAEPAAHLDARLVPAADGDAGAGLEVEEQLLAGRGGDRLVDGLSGVGGRSF